MCGTGFLQQILIFHASAVHRLYLEKSQKTGVKYVPNQNSELAMYFSNSDNRKHRIFRGKFFLIPNVIAIFRPLYKHVFQI